MMHQSANQEEAPFALSLLRVIWLAGGSQYERKTRLISAVVKPWSLHTLKGPSPRLIASSLDLASPSRVRTCGRHYLQLACT